LLEGPLRGPLLTAPCESVADWWQRHREICRIYREPFDRAVADGFAADRVAWAFASGYQSALHALFPDAPDDRICALCVTEADGNSPKAIRSSFRKSAQGWLLNGAKRWTTLGPDGALFFIAARDEAAFGERPSIRVARVESTAPGLKIETMPATRFVPEVPHAQLQFENVPLQDTALLAGDGYTAYVKPFRTVEDIYVNAAVVAYLVREARRLGWPDTWIERCCSLLLSLEKLAAADPQSPETHLALAGALAIGGGLIAESEAYWQSAPADPAAQRWQRDRELLKVASGPRAQRTKRAWELLRRPAPAG